MGARRSTPLSDAVDRKSYIVGLGRKDLAAKLGMSDSQLSLYLTGRCRPTIAITERLAEILEMDPRAVRELALKKAM